MKKSGVQLRKVYACKVSGSVVPVRLDRANPRGGWDGTNMRTQKSVRIRSAQRLRGLWPKKTLPIRPEAAPAAHVAAGGEAAPTAASGARAPAGRDTGERGATGGKTRGKSLLALAAELLAEAGGAMNCKDIVEQVLSRGLWQTKGKTPAATLYAAILREIQAKGQQARFRKVERGKFAIAS